MSARRIVRVSLSELPLPDQTDWKRVHALTDREIEAAIASDPDAAPLLDEEWFRTAELLTPQRKVPVSMRVDREVLDWFKRRGRGHLSRMHSVLRAYVNAQNQIRSKKLSSVAPRRRRRIAKKVSARR
ncbi:MAG TPA: BrnA antitoxin family protein [Candidatus Acidoferrales bacterium]|nr:BrnA antitoxin family protein [Candidatus Acidoferrales bacterium]